MERLGVFTALEGGPPPGRRRAAGKSRSKPAVKPIDTGEGHRWWQWFWIAEAYAHSGGTVRALESLDSFRSKVRPPDEPGQISRF